MTRTSRLAIAATAALTAALTTVPVTPAQAAPTWLPALTVSGADATSTTAVSVSADGAGNVTALWQSDVAGHLLVLAASHAPGAGWSARVPLSKATDDASKPELDTDDSGVVTAVWLNFDGTYTIASATRAPGGAWSPAVTVGPASSTSEPKVAVSDDGHAAATWTRAVGGFDVVQASLRSPGGAWSVAEPVSLTGQNAHAPDIDMHRSSSTAVIVWDRSDGTHTVVQRSQRSPGNTSWSTPQDMSDSGQNSTDAHVVVADVGQTTIAWTRFDGAKSRVQAMWNYDDGLWVAPQTLSAAGEDAFDVRLAVDPSSEVTVVWRRNNGAVFVVQAVSRVLEGAWGAVVPLSDPTKSAMFPNVAADPTGGALVSWYGQSSTWNVQAVRREAGAWGSVVPLGDDAWSFRVPGLAVDGAGDAVVAWAEPFASPVRIRARTLDAAGPAATALSIPVTAIVGKPVSFTASAVDTWSSVASYAWNFGDAKSASGPSVKHIYRKPGPITVQLTLTDSLGNASTRTANLTVLAPKPAIKVFKLIDDKIATDEKTKLKVKLNTRATLKLVLKSKHQHLVNGKRKTVRLVIRTKLPKGTSKVTIRGKKLLPDNWVIAGTAKNAAGKSSTKKVTLKVTR